MSLSTPSGASPTRVLVVVSAAARIPLREGNSERTGTYLGELDEPTDAMLRAGFELTFATPGGKVPTIDGTSCSLMYFGLSRAKRDTAMHSYAQLLELGLGTPIALEEIARDREQLGGFDALFVPGGPRRWSICCTATPAWTTRSTTTSERCWRSFTRPTARPA